MSAVSFNTAKVMSKGQITLPVDIRKNLGLSVGDRVALVYTNNRVIMMNPAVYAMEMLQQEMQGEAERAGLTTEEDIIELCREVRAEVEGV
jgi:AbrB family looped-hinge helix DNA binding protein